MTSNRIASGQLQDLSTGEMAAVERGNAAVLVEVVNAVIGGLTDFGKTLVSAFEIGRMLRQME